MNKIIKDFKKTKYGPAIEDSDEVMKWIKKLPKQNHNFRNGEWKKASNFSPVKSD